MSDTSPIGLGHNNPPEPIAPTPFEIAEKAVNDIYSEVTLWLDGHAIDSKEMADGVGNLLAAIRAAEKTAEEARVAEKAPHDEAIKEIQARYNALIGDTKTVKGKTVLAAVACKSALQPWLDTESRRIAEAARIAREEAERQRREAEEALRASEATNLAERAAAEELIAQAKKADTLANKAERATATAGGVGGRAIGLRTVHAVEIVDPVAAARHVWQQGREEMLAFLIGWAERQVRFGTRTIPGFEITETKVAA